MRAALLMLVLLWPPRELQAHKAKLISALRSHFHSGCVFLAVLEEGLNSDLSLKSDVLQIQRRISEGHVPTAILDSTALSSLSSSFKCTRNRALYAILFSGEGIRPYLQELFRRIHPSDSRWLLFLDSSTGRVEDLLDGVHIPFDCEFLVTQADELSEVFRVAGDLPLQAARWGSWNSRDGLRTPALSLYRRRRDLQGITFTAAAVDDPPFETIIGGTDGELQVEGLAPELYSELAAGLNFSFRTWRGDDNARGIMRDDGSWSGMMGQLVGGGINMSLNCFYLTPSRTQVMAFSVPIVRTNGYLWLAVGVSIALTAGYMAVLHHLAGRHAHPELGYSLHDALLCVWGSFCAQGHFTTPHSWSFRVVHWMTFVMAVTVMAAYLANFTSSLAVRQVVLPFTDLQGILDDKSYDFGVQAGGGLYTNFHGSSDPVMQQIYERKILPMKNRLPLNVILAFHQACDERFAFMANYDYLSVVSDHIRCDISVLPRAAFPLYLAMVFPKGNPYRGIINFKLQEMKDAGLIQRQFLAKWPQPLSATDRDSLRSVEFGDVVPLLSLWAGGGLLCLVVMILETCINITRAIFHARLNSLH